MEESKNLNSKESEMKNEKACGVVILDNKKVLLVFQQNGFWGFPKGHVEADESEAETAIREVFEETGLWVSVDEKHRFEFSYDIKDSNIRKTVVLFPAKVVDDSKFKKQEDEIAELRWVETAEVEDLLTYEDWKAVWRKIKEVL